MWKKVLLTLAFLSFIVWIIQSEWFQLLWEEDIGYFVQLEHDMGYYVLWVTIPLSILQGVVTIFPFVTLILVHVFLFGFIEGLFYSWIGATIGALLCFILGRYLFQSTAQSLWQKHEQQYGKWLRYIQLYGLWGIIVLRSIPIMPSNIISLMAALSPIKLKAYVYSSLIGNGSMVWLLGMLSGRFAAPDLSIMPFVYGYIGFILLLGALFFFHYKKNQSTPYRISEPHSWSKKIF